MNKKALGVFLGCITVVSLWFSYHYFEQAIPFVNVSVTMNKQEAKDKALQIAKKYNWDLYSYDQAVKFDSNSDLQAFVELEGGGKQAFIDMMKNNHFQPYQWQVRFFKEKEIKEVVVLFTPQGQPYGFKQIVSDGETGNNISKEEAEKIAEKAVFSWNINLEDYHLVEYDTQVFPSTRVDHSFVYERSNISLKKGLYRLKVVISADKVTQLLQYVKIPEEFSRRYEQMRSSNMLIVTIGYVIFFLLYLLLICFYGFFFLYKKRYFAIPSTIKIMSFFGILFFLASLNSLPLIWNAYSTTVSKNFFLLQRLGFMTVSLVVFLVFAGIILLLTEGMTRYMFKNHIQFFKLWSPSLYGTYSVAEQTLVGYFGAAVMLAYQILFSFIAKQYHWWVPLTDMNLDPNILSNYVPFFTPIVRALQAGFFEEVIMRALPIAGLMLLTRKSKYKYTWLFFIFVLQALLFGALHAHYPQQPSYYRVVELIIPSIMFGGMYYIFGLLPGIISHAVYDAVLMSLPIYVSSFLLQKLFATVAILAPLFVVLVQLIKNRKFQTVSQKFYNAAYKEQLQRRPIPYRIEREEGKKLTFEVKKLAFIFGLIGFGLYGYFGFNKFNTPKIYISQKEAEKKAKMFLEAKTDYDKNKWSIASQFIDTTQQPENKFIWQQYGESMYESLQGIYVIAPHYVVRFTMLHGTVEQKAHEYRIFIDGKGSVIGCEEKVPESLFGKNISEQEAHKVAYEFIKNQYQLDKNDVRIIQSDSVKYEHRRDWSIVIEDIKNYKLDTGKAVIKLAIISDTVSSFQRTIQAPQDWKRKEEERQSKQAMIQFLHVLTALLCVLFVFNRGIKTIGAQGSIIKMIAIYSCLFFFLKFVEMINGWEIFRFAADTAKPFFNQVVTYFVLQLMNAVMFGLVYAVGFVYILLVNKKSNKQNGIVSFLLTGICLGFGLAGFFQVFSYLGPQMSARSPMYEGLSLLGNTVNLLFGYFIQHTILISLIIGSLMFVSRYLDKSMPLKKDFISLIVFIFFGPLAIVSNFFHKKILLNRSYGSFLFFLFTGFLVVGISGVGYTLWYYLCFGVSWGIVWYILCHYVFADNFELLYISLVTAQLLKIVPSVAYQAYPTILFDVVVAAICAYVLMILLFRRVQSL